MGQRYRFDPATGLCDYLEPSEAQLEVLRHLFRVEPRVAVVTPHRIARSLEQRGWIKRVTYDRTGRCCVMGLTPAGIAELAHQAARWDFAWANRLINGPRLAKLMHDFEQLMRAPVVTEAAIAEWEAQRRTLWRDGGYTTPRR